MTQKPLLASLALTLALGALASVDATSAFAQAEAQPATGSAEESPTVRARVHFEAGQALVAERRFEDAYREFEAGHALSERPLFLFNMAECAREAGLTNRARRDYARYLAVDPEGSHATIAQERLAILGPERAEPIEAVPGGEGASASVPSPEATAEASVEGSVTQAGQLPGQTPSEGPEVWEDWPFWTIVGLVAVALAAGAVTIGLLTTQGGPTCNEGCTIVDWR